MHKSMYTHPQDSALPFWRLSTFSNVCHICLFHWKLRASVALDKHLCSLATHIENSSWDMDRLPNCWLFNCYIGKQFSSNISIFIDLPFQATVRKVHKLTKMAWATWIYHSISAQWLIPFSLTILGIGRTHPHLNSSPTLLWVSCGTILE